MKLEIDTNSDVRAIAFAANGKYLVTGGTKGVQVWQVEDGKRVASMNTQHVRCLAVSADGKRIAVGTWKEVVVWDAGTYESVFTHEETAAYFNGVDFSAAHSTRLVAVSGNYMASIWDIAARRRVIGPLTHQDAVIAAKYSPSGTRIATATPSSVRVYDSNVGHLLLDFKVKVPPWYNTGLVWANQHLFILSDSMIKQIDTSTGSEISEWQVLGSNQSSCITMPLHGAYIAYATDHTVTVWDLPTRSKLSVLEHPQDICSIMLSPDDRSLAIAGADGKIIIHSLSRFNDSIPLSQLHPTFREPDVHIDKAALEAWQCGRLENAEALLTSIIPTSQEPNYHALASRALVRTRLRRWDAALGDATQSIKIKPSVLGYIAKSIALVGKGEKYDGYRACDIAFERFHSTHVSTVLLIKAVIVFMAGDHLDAISRLDDLIDTVHVNSICYIVQAYMYLLMGNSHTDHENAIPYFGRARAQMRYHKSRTLSVVSLISGWKFDDLNITIEKHLCEALFATGRTKEAGELLLEMLSTVDEADDVNGSINMWAPQFVERCLSTHGGDFDNIQLLRAWAKLKLPDDSWRHALSAAVNFTAPKFIIYRSICERLETLVQMTDATECFHQMMHELRGEIQLAEQADWILDFRQRFSKKLECLGDAAVDAQLHDEAISKYSAALSLDPPSPQDLFIKRSKTYTTGGFWKDALDDANEVIKLDPSSPWGYERKHAALHQTGNYDDAIDAFNMMLSKIVHSPDPEIRKRHMDYVHPERTRAVIKNLIQDAIQDVPRVLINTVSGRLFEKSELTSSFEALPVYKEMISSMTMIIDHARIKHQVTQYYRYAMFSHRWEANEPLYDKVIRTVVYDLDKSDTHDKLQMFCKIVRDAGFHWAWSDTCCINKGSHVVLQEALVAMFKWYEGSSVTIVYLQGVPSPAQRGNLVGSVWNTRAWTFQEYHASKAVQFYTQDWKPYLNLDIWNHKESPEIISEMKEATHVSAQTLMALRPGLHDIREKLCLASRRETTLIEDAAYSLLGIFSLSLTIIYGEGDKALGRLLAELITNSGDTSILAWTGKSGRYNSCLPAIIAVFDQLSTTHVPQALSDAEMQTSITRLHASSLDYNHAQKLYERLSELSVPMFAGNRMKLPCIVFRLGRLSASQNKPERIYHAQTSGLGVVEIRTKVDLSRLESLCLVHPWIDFLLHRHPVARETDMAEETISDNVSMVSEVLSPRSASRTPTNFPSVSPRSRTLPFVPRLNLPIGGRSATPPRNAVSLLPPSSVSQSDKRTHVLHFVARLRQPFGALLFAQMRRNTAEYRRVASESTIMVQVQEDAPLSVLLENTRMLDVL